MGRSFSHHLLQRHLSRSALEIYIYLNLAGAEFTMKNFSLMLVIFALLLATTHACIFPNEFSDLIEDWSGIDFNQYIDEGLSETGGCGGIGDILGNFGTGGPGAGMLMGN